MYSCSRCTILSKLFIVIFYSNFIIVPTWPVPQLIDSTGLVAKDFLLQPLTLCISRHLFENYIIATRCKCNFVYTRIHSFMSQSIWLNRLHLDMWIWGFKYALMKGHSNLFPPSLLMRSSKGSTKVSTEGGGLSAGIVSSIEYMYLRGHLEENWLFLYGVKKTWLFL